MWNNVSFFRQATPYTHCSLTIRIPTPLPLHQPRTLKALVRLGAPPLRHERLLQNDVVNLTASLGANRVAGKVVHLVDIEPTVPVAHNVVQELLVEVAAHETNLTRKRFARDHFLDENYVAGGEDVFRRNGEALAIEDAKRRGVVAVGNLPEWQVYFFARSNGEGVTLAAPSNKGLVQSVVDGCGGGCIAHLVRTFSFTAALNFSIRGCSPRSLRTASIIITGKWKWKWG